MSDRSLGFKRLQSIRVLTFAALMIALSIVLKRYMALSLGPDLRLSLGVVPILLAGLYGGPVVGASAGVVADLVGMAVGGTGGFFWGMTLTEAVRGACPGLLMLAFKRRSAWPTVVAVSLVEYVLCSLMLQSFWLSQLLGNPYWVQLVKRLPASSILLVVYIVVLKLLLPALDRVAPRLLDARPSAARPFS